MQLNSSISSVTERIRLQGIRRNLKSGKEHIDMDALMDLTELHQVLQDYANDIRERYKDVLANNGHIASHDLVNSIKTEVVVGEQAYEVTMTLADYWKYVEYDTRPHFPPPDALQRWIEIKPVIPRPGKNGRIPTPKQLAFLIGRHINTFGTTGTHDLQKTKDDIFAWYQEKITAALGREMANYIRKIVR